MARAAAGWSRKAGWQMQLMSGWQRGWNAGPISTPGTGGSGAPGTLLLEGLQLMSYWSALLTPNYREQQSSVQHAAACLSHGAGPSSIPSNFHGFFHRTCTPVQHLCSCCLANLSQKAGQCRPDSLMWLSSMAALLSRLPFLGNKAITLHLYLTASQLGAP